MTGLVSIIVPIYGIDRYLGLCIESILNQTYKNIEIILVDDGSKDRCSELCELYASKDARIKVFHRTNGGLVLARKTGVYESNGEYIAYVDGDDWVEPGFIEALYNTATSVHADIVCAGFTRELFMKKREILNEYFLGVYEADTLALLYRNMISFGDFYRPGINTYVWNKLFKREILLESQLTVDNRISIGEDAAVTYPALLKCRRVAVIDDTSYHYRQREDSMLKQTTEYVKEAQQLKYLYDYLLNWVKSTKIEYNLLSQVEDYILANAIMRSGGRLPQDDFSIFDNKYIGEKVVIYSAGTFGQQLVNRIRETNQCHIVAWLDDDYWEYRRCCMDVDSVEMIKNIDYKYILISKVDKNVVDKITSRLFSLGVDANAILSISVPQEKRMLIDRFLNISTLIEKDEKRKVGETSHA